MDLSWASFWEASWSDFGMVFGSQDAPKKAQDDAKTAMRASFFGIAFLVDVKCDFGWVSWGVLGASWGVLGSSWGPS